MVGPENSEFLEAALDELYGADPSEFVALRKRLAGEIRATGEKDGAKAVLAARRPTTAAWALNQVGRRDPTLVEALLDASRDLHTAQTGSGGRDAMRSATRAHRDALAAATDAALAMLGSRANDAYRSQIQASLHAASVDEVVGDELRRGRLTREITGSSGFPDAPGLTLVPDLTPAAEPKRKPPPPKRTKREGSERQDAARAAAEEKAKQAEQERIVREQAAAAERERQRAEAEAAWQVAQDEAAVAESAAQAAHAQAARLEQELDDARREVRAADDRAAGARREAARLAREAMKLQP